MLDSLSANQIMTLITGFPVISALAIKFLINDWFKKKKLIEAYKTKLHKRELEHEKELVSLSVKDARKDITGLADSFRRHKSQMISQINEHRDEMIALKVEMKTCVKQIDSIVERLNK